MLDHDRGDRLNVVDLAVHHPRLAPAIEVAATTGARLGDVVNDLVRVTDLEQR